MLPLLKKLGIDPNLSSQQILDKLQEKNLECLERLESCSDPQRAAELQASQREIEDAILRFSAGVSLNRQVDKRVQSEPTAAPQAGAPLSDEQRLGKAMQDYQAGRGRDALPVLEEFAQRGDLLASMLAANLLLQSGQGTDRAKRYLYTAAERGEGSAALLLAQQYIKEGNTISAEKYARMALQAQIPSSGQLTAQLCQLNGRPMDAVEALYSALEWTVGYDRYALTKQICILLRGEGATDVGKWMKALRERLAGDTSCLSLLEEVRKEQKLSPFIWANGLGLGLLLTFLVPELYRALLRPTLRDLCYSFFEENVILAVSVLVCVSTFICALICGFVTKKVDCWKNEGKGSAQGSKMFRYLWPLVLSIGYGLYCATVTEITPFYTLAVKVVPMACSLMAAAAGAGQIRKKRG